MHYNYETWMFVSQFVKEYRLEGGLSIIGYIEFYHYMHPFSILHNVAVYGVSMKTGIQFGFLESDKLCIFFYVGLYQFRLYL